MENETILRIFIFATITLWIFLLVHTLYKSSRKILTRQGYGDEFIDFIRRTNLKRNIGIGLVVPAAGIAAWLLALWLIGDLDQPKNIIFVYLFWLLLIIPFPIMEMRSAPKELKEIIKKTNTDVIVDFGFKILHLVFNPLAELLFSLLYLAYFMFYIELFHVAFIHVGILWTLYGTLRFAKNLTRPGIREAYIFSFIFLMLNQFILIYHIMREVLRRYSCEACLPESGFILGIALGVALIIKSIYYLYKLPEFNMRLKS